MKKMLTVAIVMALVSGGVHAKTLVTVNGEKIDSAVVDAQVTLIEQRSKGQVQDSPQLRNGLLERLVGQTLVGQEAKRLKLDQSAPYQEALKKSRAAAKEQGIDKQPTFKQEFAQYERDLLSSAYTMHVATQAPVTDTEINAFYESYKKHYQGTEEVKLSEVFTANEADAQAVIKDLKSGKSFASVAGERSLDQRAKQTGGANPNYVNLKDMQQSAPTVYAAVSSLKKGQYSQPINAQNMWGVFKVDDKRKFSVPALDAMKSGIENQLRTQRVDAAMGQLFEKAKIEQ